MGNELKPCPFCGGEADPHEWLNNAWEFGPGCSQCGATAQSSDAWNRRAAPPPPDDLPRYGIEWHGWDKPISVPMADGYWTPWHLAQAALSAKQPPPPDDAVEAVAKAISDAAAEALRGDLEETTAVACWEETDNENQEQCRYLARAALAALLGTDK